MVIVLGESIRCNHDRVVRHGTSLWERRFKLFYGFAEVLRSAILCVLQIRRRTTRSVCSASCQNVPSSRA